MLVDSWLKSINVCFFKKTNDFFCENIKLLANCGAIL